MSVELLLEACRIGLEDVQLTPEIMEDLSAAYALAQRGRPGRHGGTLPHAATLLTAALGRMPRFNPTHLPFGFGGPELKSRQWVDQDRIELIMTQIIGLCQPAWDEQRVTFESQRAVSDAAKLGLIETRNYDGWIPGMASGSGWRTAVSATPYGLVRARQAAKASAEAKEPVHPWREPAQVSAPVEASAPASQVAAPAAAAAMPTFRQMATLDHHVAPPVESGPNVILLPALPSTAKLLVTPPAPRRSKPDGDHDPRYAWARQAELVRATNQTLSEGSLNPGVLSRACKAREIATNGRTGRAGMVEVDSFLAWLKKRDIPQNEVNQVRNAIIGEIGERIRQRN